MSFMSINNLMITRKLRLIIAILSFSCIFSVTAADQSKTRVLPQEKAELSNSSVRILVDKKDPYLMIKEVASNTFKRFAAEEQAIKANPNLLKDIVREELIPYINYKYSAFKVIGKHYKKVSKQELKAFVPVFREYLVTSYAQVFTLYDKQKIEFAPSKKFSDKRIVAVGTIIIMPGRENIDVSFKVRKNKNTNEWKAYDLVAEGVSLLDSKQAELGGIIRQKGLSYVTELLKKKSNRNIIFKDKSTHTKVG